MKLASFRAVAICLGLLVPAGAAGAAEKVTVFAAASLTDALNAVDSDYTKRTGTVVTSSFAASSTLARQIEAGAPAQVFISADARWMDYLAGKQMIVAASRINLLGNRLALIAPAESPSGPLAVGPGLDWDRLLGADGRLAVADPAHVPAGLYAREALEHLGQWQHLEARLARADDVRGALALVERGDAPLGIVYVTDARISPRVKILGVFPDSSHASIVYPVALVAGGSGSAAEDYVHYLRGPAARAVFARYGFLTP